MRRSLLLGVLLWTLDGAAWAQLPPCEFTAGTRIRVGDDAVVDGDLAANEVGGIVRLKERVTTADATRVHGDSVHVGPGSSVFDLFARTTEIAAGVDLRGELGVPNLPLVDPYCDVPQALPCGTDDVLVEEGATVGPLAAGIYGTVAVRNGGTLNLGAGRFDICSLRMGRNATLHTTADTGTTINVVGKIKLGTGAELGPGAGGVTPTVTAGGPIVRARRDSRLTAFVLAPVAALRVGRGARVSGGFCSASASVGEEVALGCVGGACGDGTLNQAREECDAPQDGACIGACGDDCTCPDPPGPWKFTDVTASAGVGVSYDADFSDIRGISFEVVVISGGVAAGDYDRDGWIDLYTVGGDLGTNRLLRNQGDGTFADVAAAAGVALPGVLASGPTFADYDGDGWLDLLVGGQAGDSMVLFRNEGDETFADVTAESEIASGDSNFGSSFGDYDGDGDLDAFVAHWGSSESLGPYPEHLWRNDGDGTFSRATLDAGLDLFAAADFGFTWTFTGNFADVDSDGWLDLLVASDFDREQYFINDGDGSFTEATGPVNTSENGMGSAIGDIDNDGDLDWFISSIWDPDGSPEGNWGVTGNRLYRNLGDGTFEDITDAAGVRIGYWGWGSCFADFNLDGHLDLFHVNGFDAGVEISSEYHDDPSRLFIADGDGTFTERSVELGLIDDGQGRGVVCFDYDRDGDVDIFVANGEGDPSRLFRNDGGDHGNFLQVALQGVSPNSEAIGARVLVTVGAVTQMREIRAGSNFVSQDPALAHFGVGDATVIDELRVEWPGGAVTAEQQVPVNQFRTLAHP